MKNAICSFMPLNHDVTAHFKNFFSFFCSGRCGVLGGLLVARDYFE
jgi:3',5'-cyclic AMP phosphodiesterase CpdA